MQDYQEAVNLVDCAIDVFWLNDIAPPRAPVHHTTMEKLAMQTFYRDNSDSLGSILQSLDLPSLHDFQWTHQSPYYREDISDGPPRAMFLGFLSRSGCVLSKLWINSGPTEEDSLRRNLAWNRAPCSQNDVDCLHAWQDRIGGVFLRQ